jgi:hypothetical protein
MLELLCSILFFLFFGRGHSIHVRHDTMHYFRACVSFPPPLRIFYRQFAKNDRWLATAVNGCTFTRLCQWSMIPMEYYLTTRPKMYVPQVCLTSHESKPHKKHNSPNKHDHHGGGAARPSSSVDLMKPHRPRGGRPCACSF